METWQRSQDVINCFVEIMDYCASLRHRQEVMLQWRQVISVFIGLVEEYMILALANYIYQNVIDLLCFIPLFNKTENTTTPLILKSRPPLKQYLLILNQCRKATKLPIFTIFLQLRVIIDKLIVSTNVLASEKGKVGRFYQIIF